MFAIGGIIAAISTIADLFDAGEKVYSAVTGESSGARDNTQLADKVAALAPEKQVEYAKLMSVEIERYEAETERLRVQSGEVTADILDTLDTQTKAKVAVQRMTTRPWAVRMLVHAIVWPALLPVLFNLVFAVFNTLSAAFMEVPYEIAFISYGDILNDAYAELIGWGSGIIMTYMTLRQVGKHAGHQDELTVSDVGKKVGGLISSVKNLIK